MTSFITLVCGYRRTGKDKLYNILTNDLEARFKWRIYKSPTCSSPEFNKFQKYKRIGFADTLKHEAHTEYGIPEHINDDEKDIKQFEHYKSHNIVSARDIYIELGALRRLEDKEYWCRTALTQVPNDINTNCIITDWRYKNEIQYAAEIFPHITTVRVYRSEVPEPHISIQSEHELDDYKTDFLLLCESDHVNEFNKAVKRFPQYNGYVLSDII